MSRIFQGHGSIPWGVLTARDVAGLTFQVAKVLAATRPGGGMDGVIDVIQEQVYTPSDRYSLTRESLLRMIDGDWRTLSILAHGEGAHVNLKSVVLCVAATFINNGKITCFSKRASDLSPASFTRSNVTKHLIANFA